MFCCQVAFEVFQFSWYSRVYLIATGGGLLALGVFSKQSMTKMGIFWRLLQWASEGEHYYCWDIIPLQQMEQVLQTITLQGLTWVSLL